MSSTVRAWLAGAVATFTVVVVAAGAVLVARDGRLDLTGVAVAYGAIVAAMVAATGDRGVANPAIVAGLWAIGRLDAVRAATIVSGQLVGAALAGLTLRLLLPGSVFRAGAGGVPLLATSVPAGRGLVIEALGTFVLTLAVLGVGSARGSGWPAAPAAGVAVTAAALAFFPSTGAALDPARWFGPALAAGAWSDGWVWVLGPFAGGIAGALAHEVLRPPSDDVPGDAGPRVRFDG
jgi:glycerol uptake facilitator-like aquaporin